MADWTCPEDRFPMMGPGHSRISERAITVPIAFVQAHERQAQSNHGQSIARLKERGGLGWGELADIVAGRGWGETRNLDLAHEQVMRALFAWQKASQSPAASDGEVSKAAQPLQTTEPESDHCQTSGGEA